jgi:N4-(beta-N-acetylglucosaminyl)-L-asparaginase
MSEPLSRRAFLQVSAATSAAAVVPSAVPWVRTRPLVVPIAVSSRNGKEAVKIAVQKMRSGWKPVDSAVAGIEIVENDPNDDSVGLGGLPNEDGVVELDACAMDGPSGLGGAVASLRNIKNPAQVALKVMRHTDHVLLVGEGALRFARAHGFPEENLLTEASRKKWLQWKERHSKEDAWLDPEENGEAGKESLELPLRKTGTIHVGCVNENGDIGGSTSTSGLAWKIPGRVGDSPLLGCGNYVDNDFGVAGSTGRGEAAILTNAASFIVGQMALGKSPTDACLEACKRVVRFTKVKRLLRADGRPNFDIKFYAINKQGEPGGASLYPGKYACCTGDQSELRDLAALFEKG